MASTTITEIALRWQLGRAMAPAALKVAHRSWSSLRVTPSSSRNEVHSGLSLEGRASADVKTKSGEGVT